MRTTKTDKRPTNESKCVIATTTGKAHCEENNFDKCDDVIMNINRKSKSGSHLRGYKTDGNQQMPQNQTGNKLIKDENDQNSGKLLNAEQHDLTCNLNIGKDENPGEDCVQQNVVDREVKEDASISRTKLSTR